MQLELCEHCGHGGAEGGHTPSCPKRLKWIQDALDAYRAATSSSLSDTMELVTDLLADLMHYCDASADMAADLYSGIDVADKGDVFEYVLDRARDHYNVEVQG